MPRITKYLRAALHGATGIKTSSLLQDLHQILDVRRKVSARYGTYGLHVNELEYHLEIFDQNKLLVGRSHYGSKPHMDFIIEVFAINEPRSLQEIINVNIPRVRQVVLKNRPVNVVLVGIGSELRQEGNPQQSELCPVALGEAVAQFVGAVKYVECSAESGEGVRKVFEEAIRATFNRDAAMPCTATDYLKRLLIKKLLLNDEWRSVIASFDPDRVLIFPNPYPALNNQLELLDQHLFDVASNSGKYLLEDVLFYRQLEVETMHLANGHWTGPAFHLIFYVLKVRACICKCIWWCINEHKHQTSNSIRGLTTELVCREGPTSMRFVKQDCPSIEDFILSCAPIKLQHLVITICTGTLSFRFPSALLEGLESLIIVDTTVDFTGLNFPSKLVHSLTHLVLSHCDTKTSEVPPVIGRLIKLRVLDVTRNAFTKLPVAFGGLQELNSMQIDLDRIVFPPQTVINKSAQDIVQYLKAIQEEPVENREAKLMVVGQEGVGKSTLVKSLKRSFPIFNTTPPAKTDGVDISVLQLKGSDCKVYDLAGDVEYLNTHSLFFSSNCLHLAVFNMSQFAVNKDIRSTDQFSRLELWLQTIASQDPHSCAIIVGTHADHDMLNLEVRFRIRTLLGGILGKYLPQHLPSYYEECFLCNPDKFPSASDGLQVISDNPIGNIHLNSRSIPHIVGYYEVSGITNKNIKNLKLKVGSSVAHLKLYTATETLPKIWLLLRTSITTKLKQDEELKKQPLLPLSDVHYFANKAGLTSQQSIVAMLRFFHSQGDFLWYEDIPEMKDVVILDPQWLSNQLRTLISHQSSVDSISEGVLPHSELPKLWVNMTEKNRSRLISLFRSVGLCFCISETEELFPCKLAVGWPDREMWPPLPNTDENQTSLLFLFSFVPPTFFPELIVALNKKRVSFAPYVQPLYYRFNVVYITQEQCVCSFHEEECMSITSVDSDCNNSQQGQSSHRIHLELMPYNNSLKVTIRGSNPCCMVPNIRSLIEDLKSRRYPGIGHKERIVCPECELKKVHNPSNFKLDNSRGGFCPLGHKVGSLQDILAGKLSPAILAPSVVGQTGRIVGETLEDHFCPKLFAILPINLDSLSLMDRFVYSYLRDGYTVHLLCECPGEWHFVTFPGFRVGKPKEFFKKYGSRVCKLLRVISALGAPFKIASAVEPHCKAGVATASAAETARKELQGLLENYLDKYPHLKTSLGSSNDDLKDLKSSRGLQRSELSRLLEIKTTGRDFGPLACTYVDKFNEWLWLCEEHNQKYEIVQRSHQDILAGKLSPAILAPSVVLEDHFCPKLFAVLPINLDSLSLMDRFVYSYIRDGYAVHLLCECPGEWHFVASPGFRVGKPKEFFKKYGSRVCKLLRVISALGAPFKIASAFEPHCKAGVVADRAAQTARKELQGLLENYLDKYPHLKTSLGSSNDDLKELKSSRGLQRSELSRLLEIKATGRDFGPLACTYVDKFNEWLWLCEEHNQKYENIRRSHQDILAGKLSPAILAPSVVGQTDRIVGEIVEDHF